MDHKSCWEWTKARGRKGYGQIKVDGRLWITHRLSYLLFKGNPKGKLVMHTCDNPPCINPFHLRLGTGFDNQQDAARKGRIYGQKKTACPKGHPLSGENLYLCPRGYRECKQCRRENVRRWRK